ncbi:hypothetical protein [Mycetocola miduiensis]|uniref:Uncharacterized protein n=1 Tax=Mycetocola miduiensis TaxID=995034 RepID=A0A1I4YV05_9MICO|nr:hypothetical protein [Mycetocola miduiensis]SFN41851.1 hypothetical protein SAMN05216219_0539 [Mycetocola miduiensis]
MADQPDSAWPALLDEMEADLHRSFDPEESLPWTPPADAGPLPEHLFDRARRVYDAQQRAIAALTDEQASVARHLSALRTVPSTAASGRSVYLDVVG